MNEFGCVSIKFYLQNRWRAIVCQSLLWIIYKLSIPLSLNLPSCYFSICFLWTFPFYCPFMSFRLINCFIVFLFISTNGLLTILFCFIYLVVVLQFTKCIFNFHNILLNNSTSFCV